MTPVRVGQRRINAIGERYEVLTVDGVWQQCVIAKGDKVFTKSMDIAEIDELIDIAPRHRARVTAGPDWMRFDLGGAR